MSVIGEASILVRPQTTGFQRQAESGLRGQLVGLAKTAAKTLGVAFAGYQVFQFGKQAITDAAAVQKASENIRYSYGAQSKSVLKFADDAASAYGIARRTSVEFSSTMALTARNLNLNHRQAAEMTIGLQKLSGSIGLIKGQDPAQYFDKLKIALLGNTRGLKQMGIAISTADIKNYAYSHHIAQAVIDVDALHKAQKEVATTTTHLAEAQQKYGRRSSEAETQTLRLKKAQSDLAKAQAGQQGPITAAQRALAIYGLAMQHAATFERQAKTNSDDFANSMVRLRAEFDNGRERIGEFMLVGLAPIASYLATNLPSAASRAGSAFMTLWSAVQPLIDGMKSLADSLGGMAKLAEFAATWYAFGKGAMFAGTAIAGVASSMRALVAGSAVLKGALMLAIGSVNPWILLGAAVAGVAAAIITFSGDSRDASDAMKEADNAARGLKSALDSLHGIQADVSQDMITVKTDALAYKDSIHAVSKAKADYGKNSEQYKKAVLGELQAYHDLHEANRRLAEDREKIPPALRRAGRAYADQVRKTKDYVHQVQQQDATEIEGLKIQGRFHEANQLLERDRIKAINTLGKHIAANFKDAQSLRGLRDNVVTTREKTAAYRLEVANLTGKLGHVPSKHYVDLKFQQDLPQLIEQLIRIAGGVRGVPNAHPSIQFKTPLQNLLRDLFGIRNAVLNIPSTKSVDVTVFTHSKGPVTQYMPPGFFHAGGGPAGGWGIFGEQGPELVNMPQGSFVYTAQQTRAMLAGAGGAGGDASLSKRLAKTLVETIMKAFADAQKALKAKKPDYRQVFADFAKAGIDAFQQEWQSRISRFQKVTEQGIARFDRLIAQVEKKAQKQTISERALSLMQAQDEAKARSDALTAARAGLVTAQAGGDPAAIRAAQEALLQAQADIERAAQDAQAKKDESDLRQQERAWKERRALERKHLTAEHVAALKHLRDLIRDEKRVLREQGETSGGADTRRLIRRLERLLERLGHDRPIHVDRVVVQGGDTKKTIRELNRVAARA